MKLLREVKEFRATYNRVFNLCKLITGEKKEEREYFKKYGKTIKDEETALYKYLHNPEKFKKLTNQLGKYGRESQKIQNLGDSYTPEKLEEIKNSRRLTLLLVFGYTQTQGDKKHYNLFPDVSFFRGMDIRDTSWSMCDERKKHNRSDSGLGYIHDMSEEGNQMAIRCVKNLEVDIGSLEYMCDVKNSIKYGKKGDPEVVKYVEKTIKGGWEKSKLEPEAKPLTLQEALAKITRLEKKVEELTNELEELRN